MASKLRNRQEKVLQEDTTAAENQAADIFDKCQLTHPIAHDSLNLCVLNASIMSLQSEASTLVLRLVDAGILKRAAWG